MTSVFAGLIVACALQQPSELPKAPVSLKGAYDSKGASFVPNLRNAKFTVLLFISVDCPIANRYAPEIGRIVKAYQPKGVNFFRVYLEQLQNKALVTRHGKEFKLDFKALLDPERQLVRATGVRVTPEAVVLGPDGTMHYRGRIDDQNIEHGRIVAEYRRDLRIALDELLAGKPVSVPTTAAVGCFISP